MGMTKCHVRLAWTVPRESRQRKTFNGRADTGRIASSGPHRFLGLALVVQDWLIFYGSVGARPPLLLTRGPVCGLQKPRASEVVGIIEEYGCGPGGFA